jgi:HEAT repeat protein
MGRTIPRPSLVIVFVFATVLLPAGALAAGPPQEPYWNSRPLSFWLEALSFQEPARRTEAAQSVAEIAIAHGGSVAKLAVPALVENLDDPEADVRRSAAHALEQIGPAAHPAVPALVEMFAADPESSARRGAGLALGRIDPATTRVVEQAGRSLRDADAGVRVSAAVLLMASGRASASVRPALDAALADSDPNVRLYAAAAIGRSGSPELAAPLILAGLRAKDPGLRAESAGLLPELAPGRPQIVDALAKALNDPEPQVRTAAADALGRIGDAARPALPALWSRLRDPDETVRDSVLKAALTIKDGH